MNPPPIRVLLVGPTSAPWQNSLRGAATVALGGTGFSHLVEILAEANPKLVVLDPLDVALSACLARVRSE